MKSGKRDTIQKRLLDQPALLVAMHRAALITPNQVGARLWGAAWQQLCNRFFGVTDNDILQSRRARQKILGKTGGGEATAKGDHFGTPGLNRSQLSQEAVGGSLPVKDKTDVGRLHGCQGGKQLSLNLVGRIQRRIKYPGGNIPLAEIVANAKGSHRNIKKNMDWHS